MFSRLVALLPLLGLAAAQVHTDCNPLDNSNCPPDAAFGTDHLFHFNSTPSSDLWETTAGVVKFDKDGAAFTINKQGDSPTIRTRFYFFFGRTEIWLRVAPGVGIVSSMMWLSDALDEVDWEFLGSNSTFASTNFFGKGRQDYLNGGWHPMTGMQDDFHNYTTTWTRDQIDWYIDDKLVRTLKASDAKDNYPQTPMRMSVGIWAGGDPSLPEGTRKWAGGDTDYEAGPYTMVVQKAQVTDFSTGREYKYGDKSGTWQSIQVKEGNSTALEALNKQPEKSINEKWNDLPSGAKIGVYSGAAAVAAVAFASLLFYFIRQRRRGAREARAAEQRAQAERLEMERFQGKGNFGNQGGSGADSFTEYAPEYDSRTNTMRKGDADSYHGPETTTSGPLADAPWGASAGRRSPAGNPRIANPVPSPHGFDFGVPPSPGMPPSPGLPPSGPLPSLPAGAGRNGYSPLRSTSAGGPLPSSRPSPPPGRNFTDMDRSRRGPL